MPLDTDNPATLLADGCKLADPSAMFIALVEYAPNRELCLTGCAYFNGGKCPAYLKHHNKPKEEVQRRVAEHQKAYTDQSGLIGGKWAGMTIRQIAEKEGISLNQVRQRKLDGHYKE